MHLNVLEILFFFFVTALGILENVLFLRFFFCVLYFCGAVTG